MKEKKRSSFSSVLLALVAAGGAAAQEDFAAANRKYEQGLYAEALPLYLSVNRQASDWQVLYNIGNCYYKLDHPVGQDLLPQAPASCGPWSPPSPATSP